MPRRSHLLKLVVTLTVGLGVSPAQAEATWSGQSQGQSGTADYTERCGYECAESYALVVTCHKILGKASLEVLADSTYPPKSNVRVVVEVDDLRFNLQGLTDEGGLFGPIPAISLSVTAPLIEALSAGKRFRVFFETNEPVFEGHLIGSREAIGEACH